MKKIKKRENTIRPSAATFYKLTNISNMLELNNFYTYISRPYCIEINQFMSIITMLEDC